VIPPGGKPALAKKARLRLDSKTGSWLLLYPERGLSLTPTAASILKLCSGERTIDQIVADLVQQYAGRPEAEVRADVAGFLEQLLERGLIVVPE